MRRNIQLHIIATVIMLVGGVLAANAAERPRKDDVMDINGGQIGQLSQKLYDTITGIQTGKLEDTFGWRHKVGE